MQFAPLAVAGTTPTAPPAGDPRVAAGTALKQAAGIVPTTASLMAMGAAMGGKTSLSPAELVGQVPTDKLSAALSQAIAGAVAAAPELAAQQPALDQAAAGVLAWLATQSADTTTRLSLARDSTQLNDWMGSYMQAGGMLLFTTGKQLAPDAPPAP